MAKRRRALVLPNPGKIGWAAIGAGTGAAAAGLALVGYVFYRLTRL